ncbi:unnamed protein product [Rotaria socialis]|uniref:Uncharacterized protein n=1 Tax=Rotaria socialis TaxID=392032 RepID=A0A818JZ12_9BILA|nr:unnamed protein product [Rotaria socialis]CAF3392969.1 unnamed protein product [Rotaria socialis]CAF3425988.1 unnamed protein product [Rotaria socialis]CAF3455375.1 unnamed protein product [Rotaria socialis]CAF3548281.1 unnamed protein product [Rotaria socialis]
MTTSRIPSDYYASDEFTPANNRHGVVTNKTRKGSYNLVEKDYGDHKVIYHVPVEYGDDYDISQLEDMPTVAEEDEEQRPQQLQSNAPKLIHRRIYHQYGDLDDNDNDDDDDEYVEEQVIVRPRRRTYASPRRQRNIRIVDRIYEAQQPTEKIEYIIDNDYSDNYDNRPESQEEVEYVVRQRVPKEGYMEESQPIQRIVYTQDPSIPLSSAKASAIAPFRSPVSYSPGRSSYQSSPRPMATQKSPTLLPPAKFNPHNEISPLSSPRKQQTARSPLIPDSLSRPNVSKSTEPPLRLMDIIAQNRAKRGSRIPKPRREIDEEKVYDPPTYNRNIIKNGFIVHK